MIKNRLLLVLVEDFGVGIRISRRFFTAHQKAAQITFVLGSEGVTEIVSHLVV